MYLLSLYTNALTELGIYIININQRAYLSSRRDVEKQNILLIFTISEKPKYWHEQAAVRHQGKGHEHFQGPNYQGKLAWACIYTILEPVKSPTCAMWKDVGDGDPIAS